MFGIISRFSSTKLTPLSLPSSFSISQKPQAGLRVSNNSPRNSSGGSSNRPLHIVHVASEAAPFAKVGGLADVVSALARAHQAGGTHVELVLPKYDCGDYGSLSELRELGRISVPWGGGGSGDGSGNKKTRGVPTAVWGALCSGLPTYLLEPLEPLSTSSSSSTLPPPFWRGNAYGSPDDAERFLFFAIAALEFLLWAGRSPDVIHCHDWQSASVPLLLEAGGYRRKRGATFGGGLGFFGGSEGGGGGRGEGESLSSSPLGNGPLATTGTVLTIHNLAFPGRVNPSVLSPIVSGKKKRKRKEERERERERGRERKREKQTHLRDLFSPKKKKNLFLLLLQEPCPGTPPAPRPRAGSPTPSSTERDPAASTAGPTRCF